MIPTNTTSTTSSTVTAAPWGDEYAVFGDAPGGYVEIWRLVEGGNGEDANGVIVDRLDIGEGCCGNPIWVG